MVVHTAFDEVPAATTVEGNRGEPEQEAPTGLLAQSLLRHRGRQRVARQVGSNLRRRHRLLSWCACDLFFVIHFFKERIVTHDKSPFFWDYQNIL